MTVDTFFFLSGFLAAYIGLKKLPSNANPLKVFAGYMWERWIRLTPAYLFILMFYIHLLPFLAVGPDASSSMEYIGPRHQHHLHDGVRRLQPGGGAGHFDGSSMPPDLEDEHVVNSERGELTSDESYARMVRALERMAEDTRGRMAAK